MNTTIAVDKSVAMPVRKADMRTGYKYPYERMNVGDSFVVNTGSKYLLSQMCTKNKWEGEKLGMEFVARQMEDGVRVWRVA